MRAKQGNVNMRIIAIPRHLVGLGSSQEVGMSGCLPGGYSLKG